LAAAAAVGRHWFRGGESEHNSRRVRSQAKSGKDCGGKQLSDRRVLRPTGTRIALPVKRVGPTDAVVRVRDGQTSAAPGDNDDATRRIITRTTRKPRRSRARACV